MTEKTPSPENDVARSDPKVADQNREALKEEAEKGLEGNRQSEEKHEQQK